MTRRDLPLALVAVVPVAVGVFAEGGYSDGARVAFGALALAAAAVVLAVARGGGRTRDPLLIVLVALAALGALSALWTIGPVDRTLRWALVTAGYAGVFAAAAAAARRPRGVEVLAVALAAIAVVAAGMGLGAAALLEPPFAERIAGVWRPGGPFEYPPALALLEVSALPALLTGMASRSRTVAGLSAAGAALAGGVLALGASRLSLAMAVVVAGIALARAPRAAPVAAALGIVVGAGVALQLAPGGRLGALVAVAAMAVPLWLAARTLRPAPLRPATGRPRLAITAATLVAALATGTLAFGPSPGRGDGPASGFLHGRADTWRAAAETFADRPLKGTGADAFLTGSARHQHDQTIVFAHDLPLELAAELGIAGLLLALALYASTARLILAARSHAPAAAWLFGPAAAAFLVSSLVDWPWHLAGSGAIWALAAGALAGSMSASAKEPRSQPR